MAGVGGEALDDVEVGVGEELVARLAGEPAPLGGGLTAPVPPGEQAPHQGEVRDQAEAEVLTGRGHVGLGTAVEQAVLVLGADEAVGMVDVRGPIGVGDLPAAEV